MSQQTWTEERIAKLCLGSYPNFGSRTLRRLFQFFPDAKSAWLAKGSDLIAAGLGEEKIANFLEWRNTFNVNVSLKLLEEQSIHVIFRRDADYPPAFEHSSDPPEILFVRGTLKNIPCISVVGTRRITSYGVKCLELIIPPLVRVGLAIVSGLALGVDAEAHRQTLLAGGITYAILGTGVDEESIYPRENVSLAHDIMHAGGAIISEFPPGAEGRKERFPMRNRLIATLGAATLIVEATEKSGSLITAASALEENRDVLAVPGPIWNTTSVGTNQLLKSGAKVCTSAQDVLDILAFDQPELIREARESLPPDPSDIELLNCLTEPLHIDRIAELVELNAAAASAKIALLELKGYVKPMGGGMWMKAPGI
ncbi:MAG: DNA-processing protein DprA [bacterium]|nr:DNA-processing protein DprA [bacterium]